jgi:hypothetical protein
MPIGFATPRIMRIALARAFRLLTQTSGAIPCFSRLSENSIDDVGCYHLSEALRTTASLEELG